MQPVHYFKVKNVIWIIKHQKGLRLFWDKVLSPVLKKLSLDDEMPHCQIPVEAMVYLLFQDGMLKYM